MDLTQPFLKDLLLNVVASLAAAGFLLTVYSMLRRGRSSTAKAQSAGSSSTNDNRSPDNSADRSERPMQFVQFGSLKQNPTTASATGRTPIPTPSNVAEGRRNLVEIMALARKMVDAGAPAHKIKAVLPVSEAELALLGSAQNE
jgi:hypothetical protein